MSETRKKGTHPKSKLPPRFGIEKTSGKVWDNIAARLAGRIWADTPVSELAIIAYRGAMAEELLKLDVASRQTGRRRKPIWELVTPEEWSECENRARQKFGKIIVITPGQALCVKEELGGIVPPKKSGE
jgi:hypothetical protein